MQGLSEGEIAQDGWAHVIYGVINRYIHEVELLLMLGRLKLLFENRRRVSLSSLGH